MELLPEKTPSDLCSCGEESDYGAHGLRDGEIYDEYFCEKCWNKKNNH